MRIDKFYEEVAPMLVKLGYCKWDGPVWKHKDGFKMGHWTDIVLYHMGFCMTLETSDPTEQQKRYKKIMTEKKC